jgi:hypothetical protein
VCWIGYHQKTFTVSTMKSENGGNGIQLNGFYKYPSMWDGVCVRIKGDCFGAMVFVGSRIS